ncbi:hypothetical protein MFFC18_20920 [Mariniblastus fucicola]|uniref:Uncharacterized protein n=1 Tax=Mariniblastus fucicola TaxID=980251 RepID=A0A5B9PCG4_9BACT|nr:hypothetical protein MFFC18_20920 [Mariniblastus fucicola]
MFTFDGKDRWQRLPNSYRKNDFASSCWLKPVQPFNWTCPHFVSLDNARVNRDACENVNLSGADDTMRGTSIIRGTMFATREMRLRFNALLSGGFACVLQTQSSERETRYVDFASLASIEISARPIGNPPSGPVGRNVTSSISEPTTNCAASVYRTPRKFAPLPCQVRKRISLSPFDCVVIYAVSSIMLFFASIAHLPLSSMGIAPSKMCLAV